MFGFLFFVTDIIKLAREKVNEMTKHKTRNEKSKQQSKSKKVADEDPKDLEEDDLLDDSVSPKKLSGGMAINLKEKLGKEVVK